MKHNNTTFTLSNNWHLLYDDKKIKANVPGDITIDIYNAGEILDPYFAENYKKAYWITRRDFTYEYELEVSKELYSHDVIELIFKGIDLYSNIYINDTLLGSTKNMFLKYTYDIKPHVHVGKNIIKVDMFSTLNKMDTFDTKDYFSIFNVPRIFTRKAQCHFGWDWAPKICGYGIWDDVIISAHNKEQIDNVKVVARKNGDLSFFFELNHSVRELPEGSEKEYINVYVSKTPNGDEYIKDSIEVTGIKNFINFKFDNPELWWPVGYGAHPLYNYKVELVKGDKILDLIEGRFGFRDVTLK